MDDLRQRDPRERSEAFKGWIAGLPCIACMSIDGTINRHVHVAHVRFSDAEASWRSVGMQEKPSDFRCVPLCPAHHTGDSSKTKFTQHNMGEREFYEMLHVNVIALVGRLVDAFERQQSGAMVIATFAATARRSRNG